MDANLTVAHGDEGIIGKEIAAPIEEIDSNFNTNLNYYLRTNFLHYANKALQIILQTAWGAFGILYIIINLQAEHIFFYEYLSISVGFWKFVLLGGLLPAMLLGLAVSGIVQFLLMLANTFNFQPKALSITCFILLGGSALYLTVRAWVELYRGIESVDSYLELPMAICSTLLIAGLFAIVALPAIYLFKTYDDWYSKESYQAYLSIGIGLLSGVLCGIFSGIMLALMVLICQIVRFVYYLVMILLGLFLIGLIFAGASKS